MSPAAHNALVALVASLTPYSVIEPDALEAALQQSTTPFLVFQELDGDEDLNGFGDPNNACLSETGGFSVDVFVPAPQSSGDARTLGETIRQGIRYQTLLSGALRTFNASPPVTLSLNDGLWTSAAINADYDMEFYAPIV